MQPKYQLGQKVEVVTMGIRLIIEVTKRIVEKDYDSAEKIYYYNLKHFAFPDGWTWDRISEERLSEWIQESKYAQTR